MPKDIFSSPMTITRARPVKQFVDTHLGDVCVCVCCYTCYIYLLSRLLKLLFASEVALWFWALGFPLCIYAKTTAHHCFIFSINLNIGRSTLYFRTLA